MLNFSPTVHGTLNACKYLLELLRCNNVILVRGVLVLQLRTDQISFYCWRGKTLSIEIISN